MILPLAGWKLVLEKGLSAWWLIVAGLAGALGSLLGAWFYYFIGAWGGRRLLERFGRYFLISRKDIEQADRWFAKRGELTVFLTRMIPLVRTFISVPAGVARMNFWKFSLYTFLGAFVWAYSLAWGGFALGENWESVRSWMKPADLPIIILILAGGSWYVWLKIKEIRAEGRTPGADDDRGASTPRP